jgi:peptide/nickel transport system substrate-binding protein
MPGMFRLIVILLFFLLLLGCEPTSETGVQSHATRTIDRTFRLDKGRYGGVRVMGNMSLPTTFNPYLASENTSLSVIYRMFSGLVRLNAATRKIESDLAAAWQVSSDHKQYTFRLRPGLRWSDGVPLTSEDVKFTYQQVINNPEIPNSYRDFWSDQGGIPEIRTPDTQTIYFILKRPFAPALFNFSAPILPRHVFLNSVYPGPDQRVPFNSLWGVNTPPERIVVNGPWRLGRYLPGQRVELLPNPYYYERDSQGQRLPYLNQLIFIDVQNANTALLKFLEGETDVYELRPEEYEFLEPLQKKRDFTIYNLGSNPSSLFVMFNQTMARHADGKAIVDPVKTHWFRNLRFRQALAHTLNKPGLIESVYRGRAIAQTSHLNPHNPYFDQDLSDYTYNPDLARKILKSAGFFWSPQGYLYDSEGHRVEFELSTNPSNPERDATCALLRREWQKLGIKVNYRPQTLSSLVHRIHHTFNWEVVLLGMAGSSFEPHFSSSRWKTSGRMHLFNLGHPSRWKGLPTRYESWELEMEKIYARAAQVSDQQQRRFLYSQAQRLERQNLPFLYTVSELSLVAVRNQLGNIYPSIWGGSGLNQINWNSQYHFIRRH